MAYDRLLLASTSPRRRQLLELIGVRHETASPDVDESRLPGESPHDYVLRLACDKARAGLALGGGGLPVLAADTTVAIGEEIYGKPEDRADAVRMLQALAGRSHEVLTGVALAAEGGLRTALSRTRVSFRPIPAEECGAYWDTGEPAGKAGAYAIQGYAAVFVTGIEGSYTGVMGLPLYETASLLDAAGVARWTAPR